MINALSHGKAFCDRAAASRWLHTGMRPLIGTLAVGFAKVAAIDTFNAIRPFDSRQLQNNLSLGRPPGQRRERSWPSRPAQMC